ncbi:MAG: hypothetical protein GC181_13420 [Bacteroidetes bacterium]|nr:hypothetical protein [Bacteroidota bacterium]
MKKIILTLFTGVQLLYSCQDNNQKKSDNYSNKTKMEWKSVASDLLATTSQAENETELISDLAKVYSKIQDEHYFMNKQILAFVDGTNGVIYFSSLEKQDGNNIDSLTLSVNIPEIWEQNIDNSYDFDELVMQALKAALTFNDKKESNITSYKVTVETELGDRTKIN